MNASPWVKNVDVVVLPRRDGGYKLFNRARRCWTSLDPQKARLWDIWNPSQLCDSLDDLLSAGVVNERGARDELAPLTLDDLHFTPAAPWARSYTETPDLTITFNSRCMPQNN